MAASIQPLARLALSHPGSRRGRPFSSAIAAAYRQRSCLLQGRLRPLSLSQDVKANLSLHRYNGGARDRGAGRIGGGGANVRAASRRELAPSFGVASSHPSIMQLRFSSSPSGSSDKYQPPLPLQFLEAYDEEKFDPSTHQRNDVPFDPVDGKPLTASSDEGVKETKLTLWQYAPFNRRWLLTRKGGTAKPHSSYYSSRWVDAQVDMWRADTKASDIAWSPGKTYQVTKRVLWSNWTADLVRDHDESPILFQYDTLAGNDASQSPEERRLLKALYQYGLVLISGTPTYTDALPREVMSEETKQSQSTNASTDPAQSAESAILNIAKMIGYHPLRTLYGGGVWSTSSHYDVEGEKFGAASVGSASTADSAYGSASLPLHTDMTYLSNPPGVQVFLMVQPATASASGGDATIAPNGQSVYADGFAAAQQLLVENPEAFRLLATTPRRYRCVDDDEGWHLEATGTVIETVPGGVNEWGPVKSIRHNDLDRLPDLPPYSARGTTESDAFYEKLRDAHAAWDNILRRDSTRLVIDLRPGECVLVANQRCMHARYAFEASAFPRVVMGCYVGMDELASKWRTSGIDTI